jgi:hypothetical protein
MQTLKYGALTYSVDHAVKGADYIHGYDSDGNRVVAFDGVADFSKFEYTGVYLAPEDCLSEPCNNVLHVGGKFVRQDGTPIADGAVVTCSEQELTPAQQMQARANIGAASAVIVSQLVAGTNHVYPTVYEIDTYLDSGNRFRLVGTLTSSGAYAYLDATFSGISNRPGPIAYRFPDALPLTPLFDHNGLAKVLEVVAGGGTAAAYLEAGEEGHGPTLCIGWDASVPDDTMHIFGGYQLEAMYVPELGDGRIGYDGKVYPTIGDAIRGQMKQAMESIGVSETVIVEEKEYDFTANATGDGSGGWTNYSIQLIADETYRVVWGDKDYICKAKYDAELKGLYLGNISLLVSRVSTDGEPFLFVDAFPVIMWTSDSYYTSLVVGVYHQYTESVRYTKQTLTPQQQAQARANIGAAAAGEGGGGSIAVTDDGNGNVTINSQALTVTDDGNGNVSLN